MLLIRFLPKHERVVKMRKLLFKKNWFTLLKTVYIYLLFCTS